MLSKDLVNKNFTQEQSGARKESKKDNYLTLDQRNYLEDSLEKELRTEYQQRIKIMLLADVGLSQTQICSELNCAQETARFWIFMARSGQAQSWKSIPIGRPKTIGDNHLARLKELVCHSPREYGYPFQKWTARWLNKHLKKEYDIQVSDRHINRLLKKMGFSTKRFKP